MAVSTFYHMNSFIDLLGKKAINLTSDTVKWCLVSSALTPNVATHDSYDDISANEIANQYGYTTGGKAAAITWGTVAAKVLDSADVEWSIAGGTATAKYAFAYFDAITTPVNKPLIGYYDLDTSASGGITRASGTILRVVMNASGVFQLG